MIRQYADGSLTETQERDLRNAGLSLIGRLNEKMRLENFQFLFSWSGWKMIKRLLAIVLIYHLMQLEKQIRIENLRIRP